MVIYTLSFGAEASFFDSASFSKGTRRQTISVLFGYVRREKRKIRGELAYPIYLARLKFAPEFHPIERHPFLDLLQSLASHDTPR